MISFSLGKHFGFAHFGDQYEDGSYVKIGCEGHSLSDWQKRYEEIGDVNGYSDREIEEYGMMINLLAVMKYNRERQGDEQ